MDPKKCTEWKIIDIPSEIVSHLQHRNRNHFGQAHGTPFTTPLSDHLGFAGDGKGAAQILNGTYDSSQLNKSVQQLISHLKYTHEIEANNCRPTISDAEFSGKLRIWRESTATSPSEMHLGHCKALVARHSFSSNADENDLTPEFINPPIRGELQTSGHTPCPTIPHQLRARTRVLVQAMAEHSQFCLVQRSRQCLASPNTHHSHL